MRLELETTHMTLNEFVDRVMASDEPVELTRDAKVVVMAAKKSIRHRAEKNGTASAEQREKNRKRLEQLLVEVRTKTAKHYKSTKEVEGDANAAVKEVRKQNAARSH